MKFLIDAQLPFALEEWLKGRGLDAIHTADLPKGNLTSDREVADVATREDRTLISKDSNFLKLKILLRVPTRLLLITTDNINNAALCSAFERNFTSIIGLFRSFEIVELNNNFVIGRNLD